MTVYVDDVRHKFKRMIMCHMWADTETELHEMAEKIGLQRKWFQEPPRASWKHYDVCLKSKARALELGAVLKDKFAALEYVYMSTNNEAGLKMIYEARRKRVVLA